MSLWSEKDELLILDIWEQYEQELRTCIRSSEVYAKMAEFINGKTDGAFTAKEVHLKIRNLRERFRAENIRMENSNELFSKWMHYDHVRHIIENNGQSSAVKIKKDPLDDPLADELPLTVRPQSDEMGEFSSIPSPSSEHTYSFDESKPTRKRRKEWTEEDNLVLFDLWERYGLAFGKNRQNAHAYAQIASAIKKFNADEVHTKIRNLVEKYRTIKREHDKTGVCSQNWAHYDRVHKIVTNQKKESLSQNQKSSDSFMCSNSSQSSSMKNDKPTMPSAFTSTLEGLSLKYETPLSLSACISKGFKKKKRRSRSHWTMHDTLGLLKLWKQYEPELRSTARNGHIYVAIAKKTNKFDAREVFNKIRNLTQKYRKDRREMETSPKGSFEKWTFYDLVHLIIGDRDSNEIQMQRSENDEQVSIMEFSDSHMLSQYGENDEEQDESMDFLPMSEQSHSNSMEAFSSNKVSSSPLNQQASPEFSPFSIVSAEILPDSEAQEADKSLQQFLPKSTGSASSETLPNSKKRREESLQAEILDNIKSQTAILQKLSEQVESLNENFEKFVDKQNGINENLVKILHKISDK